MSKLKPQNKKNRALNETVVREILREEMMAFDERFEKRHEAMKEYIYCLFDKVFTEIRDMRSEHSANTTKIPELVEITEFAH